MGAGHRPSLRGMLSHRARAVHHRRLATTEGVNCRDSFIERLICVTENKLRATHARGTRHILPRARLTHTTTRLSRASECESRETTERLLHLQTRARERPNAYNSRGAPRGEFVQRVLTCRSSQSSFYLGEIFSDTAARSCSATHSSLGQLPEKMRTDDER